jgi:hypothetical protein
MSLVPLTNKCAECGVADYYSDNHRAGCSREEDLEMCGACDQFYLAAILHKCEVAQ